MESHSWIIDYLDMKGIFSGLLSSEDQVIPITGCQFRLSVKDYILGWEDGCLVRYLETVVDEPLESS